MSASSPIPLEAAQLARELRQKRRRRSGLKNNAAVGRWRPWPEIADEVAPPPEVRGAVCQCVTRLAATLKPEYADALQRIEVQGVPVKTYAEEHGISASNAAVRVFRAREALRKQVAVSCGTCADHGCLECTCEKSPTKHCGA